MKAKDFTPEFVRPKLSNYVINQNFPEELYEIGNKVYITSVSNVELEPVETIEGNFRVEGTATLETQTDMGEGDSMDGSYPMTFSLDFDSDGIIVRGNKIEVDTDSFFEGGPIGSVIKDPKFEITPKGDYLHIVCVKCQESSELHFKGHDPTMVLIEIICPNCGTTGDWKLYNSGDGFPPDAWKPEGDASE
jgi:Predicted pPIWI-associating nuclease